MGRYEFAWQTTIIYELKKKEFSHQSLGGRHGSIEQQQYPVMRKDLVDPKISRVAAGEHQHRNRSGFPITAATR